MLCLILVQVKVKWFQGLRHPWDGHDDHSHGHGHGNEVGDHLIPSIYLALQNAFF
jgi:hypothetical protein